jgi:hypothetical protein
MYKAVAFSRMGQQLMFETKNFFFFFLNVKIIAANLAYLVTTGGV